MGIVDQLKDIEDKKYNLILVNSVIIIGGERIKYRDDEGGCNMLEVHNNKECIAATHITDLKSLQLATEDGKDIDLFW